MQVHMRHIPPGLDPAAVAAIDACLDDLVRKENIAIGLAVESGSRAWGFPSPDSDYDCRFIFIRPMADYLTLLPKRDVIETPPAFLDVSGWDIAKALRLLLNGNAVLIEWLTSPIVYRGDADFRQRFLDLAEAIADRPAIMRHYYHFGRQLRDRLPNLRDAVPLKKLFYVLRPAIALRWMRLHPAETIAPMHFQTLCAEADLSPGLMAEIDGLVARKAETRELGTGPMPPLMQAIITAELDGTLDRKAPPDDGRRLRTADAFFREVLAALAPPAVDSRDIPGLPAI
jgi:predicted nucleotidyltransferase